MNKILKLSEIFEQKNNKVGTLDIRPMSCTNDGIIPRDEIFSKKLAKSLAKNKIANKGDFVFGMSRKILNYGMMKYDEGCFSSAYKIYKCNLGYEFSIFLDLYIKFNHDYFYQSIVGGAREGQSVSEKILFDLEVEVPTDDQLKGLIKFYSVMNKQIELKQEINRNLDEISKTIFKSWFIDFDPVRAKAEGRPTGLSQEISDLFCESFKDSELDEIPKNYKVGKLEEIAKYLNRGVSPTYVENNGVYLVNQKCIRNGEINFNLCKQSKEKSSMDERYLEKYDILLNSMGVGTLGRVAMFHKFDKKITADALVTIIKGDSVGSSFFIYYFLARLEDYLNTISVGSTGQTSLKKEDILNLKMVIPPKKLLDEFGSQLSMFAEKKYLNTQESIILADLRDTLLPKLISGELIIPDVEELNQEAST